MKTREEIEKPSDEKMKAEVAKKLKRAGNLITDAIIIARSGGWTNCVPTVSLRGDQFTLGLAKSKKHISA